MCKFVDNFSLMKFTSSGTFIIKLNNLFNGLIALPLLLVGYGYLEIKGGFWEALIEPTNAMVIGMSLGISGLITYLSLRFKKEVRGLTTFDTLSAKMDGYYTLASFYYWSVFGLSVITTSMLYLFGHLAFALDYAFIIFWLSVIRPTLRSIADIFDLKDEEKRLFIEKEELPIT